MDKIYNAKDTEDRIYQMWETSGVFAPKNDPEAKTLPAGRQAFTIIMPPPNANDPLHIGHAMYVVEDILIRYHRMRGEATLWLPGTDHAGIETQFVFEKKLKKEGKSRFDFDRKTLYNMIWDYVQKNSGIAVAQLKKLGFSPDWSRFKFTLDPQIVDLVLETFFELHKRGLVYRDLRLVNYCTRCGTGYSELEAKHEVKKDPFIYIKYGPFTIGTVRPETKFRDTALAVNPTDKRYSKHIGKTFEIMGLLGPITMTVIADPDVDPEFGTGIMKVTPAHDFHDFELGKQNNLPVTPIVDFNGKMDFSWFLSKKDIEPKYKERAERYHGLHVSKARPMMIEDLKADGLLEKIDETYEHTLSTCYRCGSVLEPLPLPQFFLSVKPMTQKALKALRDKKVKIHGPGYDKILVHWLENLKDWNISRQIVWGIRIPAWYSTKDYPNLQVTFLGNDKQLISGAVGELLKVHTLEDIRTGIQSLKAPVDAKFTLSKTSPGDNFIQETDTFDTWFSSAQWPFVTLQANKPGDFERFYPTQVMDTAYDILIFWVMRMIMMGLEMTGEVPFEHVYLHGLVRDEKGQKMSKSKGNVINPLEYVEKFGADALRMALVMSTTAGKDSNTGKDKIRGMRNFTNKVWNAGRFMSMANQSTEGKNDKDFHAHLNEVVKTITRQLDQLKVGLAAETVYNEFWHWFCDACIEQNKKGKISLKALTQGFETFLKLLHPFMPFVTEEIWDKLARKEKGLLIAAHWPTSES
ncbi:valine--tRNA ligase [Candidatus Gottesmanbacteria bacterium RIFCSPHIGHO2_01_FULL_46_14]|uniref:Valine--tRNA ligase n=1 Tax=Candidatus Gottesmanbacteria bacterium RIFCSPHIGHO2_01_FULL_46_14 TaxID=1798380 RepID=A0A1F5ZM71_9BACT|nr:MAG: valine--tRNA ligase [Candidatus Gottesmanbacteria bacterium RIFCSPHIGHO2_01_FULL_46_14]